MLLLKADEVMRYATIYCPPLPGQSYILGFVGLSNRKSGRMVPVPEGIVRENWCRL